MSSSPRSTAAAPSGAANTYGNDFIELYNRGTTAVNLDGWSVQYKSAAGTGAFQVQPLTGTIPAGNHYLIQEGTFTTGTQYPADEQGNFTWPSAPGWWPSSPNTTSYPTFGTTTGVDVAGNTANGLVDLVGYGNHRHDVRGARTGVNLTATTTAQRNNVGADTDHNANDFTELAPTPENCNCAVPTTPKLVISEVFSHGTSGGPHGADFVEVHNFGTTAADLTQVTLDVAGAPSVPLSGSLAAGGRQVVDVDLADDNGSTRWSGSTTAPSSTWSAGAPAPTRVTRQLLPARPPRARSATRTTPTPTRTVPTSAPPSRAAARPTCRRRPRSPPLLRSRAPARRAPRRVSGSESRAS